MNIYVWSSFSKRRNSTAQPTGGTLKTVYLKEETSIEKPSFILAEPIADYTYVQAFGRYYFVTDVINLDASRSEIVCDLDVLATYKSDILAYTAFVERAASSYDEYINDPLLSQRQMLYSDSNHITTISSFFSQTGCYVVECLAKNKGVVLYASSTLDAYKYILLPDGYTANDVSDWVTSQISQSFDLDVYIGGVKWMPFSASNLGTLVEEPNHDHTFTIGPVDIAKAMEAAGGTWSYNMYMVPQSGPNSHKSTTETLTLPAAGLFNDFRDCNPNYTQYTLYLPGVGIVPLDTAVIGYAIHKSKTIYVDIWCDLVSGEITYRLRLGASGDDIGRYSGNIAVDVPVGKAAVDVTKSAKLMAGSIGAGAAAGGWIGAALGAAAGVVEAIHNAMHPDVSMVGGAGNKAELANVVGSIHLNMRQYGSKDYPTAVAGRPLMQNVTLSSLSGYVKCGNASVPLAGHEGDMAAVNNYLNSGFYIE